MSSHLNALVFARADRLTLPVPPSFRDSPWMTLDSEPFISAYSFQTPRFSPSAMPSSRGWAPSHKWIPAIVKPPLPLLTIPTPPLRHVPVRGDGRCLFRAIAKNLAKLDGRSLSEHMERQDADYLRNRAWTAICKTRRTEFERRHVIEGSMTSYCAASRNPTFYGGEPEMLALADELKMPIAVYLRTDRGRYRNIVTYGEEYKAKLRKAKPSIRDPSIRILYVNGNHYDALFPK